MFFTIIIIIIIVIIIENSSWFLYWLQAITSYLAKLGYTFCLFSFLIYIPSCFLSILAYPNKAHFWISSTGMLTSVVLKLSFNRSGIDPNTPTCYCYYYYYNYNYYYYHYYYYYYYYYFKLSLCLKVGIVVKLRITIIWAISYHVLNRLMLHLRL